MAYDAKPTLTVIAIGLLAATSADADGDPLATGRAFEFSLGAETTLNTLQQQLTTPNNAGVAPFPPGPTVQPTSILDLGTGGRVELGYRQDVFGGRRGFVDLTYSATEDDGAFTGSGDAFPGSFDDGFTLPPGNPIDIETMHRHFVVTAGAEVAAMGDFTLSAGVQAVHLQQDTEINNPAVPRQLTIDTSNTLFGVMGRAEHHTEIGDGRGLRVTGTIGLLRNAYDYQYLNLFGGVPAQQIDVSGSRGALSAALSVRYEHELAAGTLFTAEIGYDGFYGVVNGFDTFLDNRGTATSAFIEGGHIGSAHLSLGVVRRF